MVPRQGSKQGGSCEGLGTGSTVLVGLLPPPQLLAIKAIEIQVAEGTAIFRAMRWFMQISENKAITLVQLRLEQVCNSGENPNRTDRNLIQGGVGDSLS